MFTRCLCDDAVGLAQKAAGREVRGQQDTFGGEDILTDALNFDQGLASSPGAARMAISFGQVNQRGFGRRPVASKPICLDLATNESGAGKGRRFQL